MRCIKTGCSVQVHNRLYHGDLFIDDGELVLRGVPQTNRAGDYFVEGSYPYHCTVDCVEFQGTTPTGYGIFLLEGEVKPTTEFLEFVQKWDSWAATMFKLN